MPTATGLASAAARYRADLAPDGLDDLDLTALDDVGVAVHLSRWHGCGAAPAFAGIGYGTTPEQAEVGALGETVERAASWRHTATARPRWASTTELRAAGAVALGPREVGADAGTEVDDDAPRAWLPGRRLVDDAEVWLPVEHVVSTPGEASALGVDDPVVTPVSNGLGAGADRSQAVLHALLEVLQRDGNGLRFRAFDAGHVLDLDELADDGTHRVLAALRRRGVAPLVKLAADDFGMANVVVVGAAPDDDLVVATACGEAVHPDREVAVRKAVCEFAAARIRKRWTHLPVPGAPADAAFEHEEPRVLAATLRWLADPPPDWPDLLRHSVFRQVRRTPLAQVPTTPTTGLSTAAVLDVVLDRLRDNGFEPVVVDLARPADGRAGVHAVKVVVPGLEVETVAYGRIGARNVRRLLADGRYDLVRVGPRPDGAGWARVALTPDAERGLGGPAWLDRDALDRSVGPLLPLYREPGQHAAQAAIAAGWRP